MIQEVEGLAERAVDLGLIEHARRGFRMLSLLRWEQGLSSAAERNSLRAMILTRAVDDRQRILGLAEAARCLTLLERDPGQADALVLEAQAMAERHGKEPDGIADTFGMLRLQQGDLDEAARLFERARDAAPRRGAGQRVHGGRALDQARDPPGVIAPEQERSRPSCGVSPRACALAVSCRSRGWSMPSAG